MTGPAGRAGSVPAALAGGLLLTLAPGAARGGEEAASAPPVESRALLTIPESHGEIEWSWSRSSPDGSRFAYQVKRDGRAFWVVDGKEGRAFEAVDSFTFSPDGRRHVYRGREGTSFVTVLGEDGRETVGEGFAGMPVFSGDGARLAYGIKRDGAARYVVDGKEGPPYDSVFGLRFSPDGARYAYGATKDERYHLVLDGKELGPFRQMAEFAFDGTGKRFAYTARRPEGDFVLVVDGTIVDTGPYLGDPALSPDGTRLAYVAGAPIEGRRNRFALRVRVDGKDFPAVYEQVNAVRFSPNSRRVGWVGTRDQGRFAVIDGEEFGPYRDVFTRLFQERGEGTLISAQLPGGERILIVNGEEREPVPGLAAMTPDLRRFAAVLPGGELGRGPSTLEFEGRTLATCDRFRSVRFTDDGATLSWLCLRGRELARESVVVGPGRR